jgi:peptidoglycan DL-endopeptidase CwlO
LLRYRIRRRWRRARPAITAIAAGLVLAALIHTPQAGHTGAATGTAPSPAAAAAIGYTRTQLGKPYVWGATGPDAFDCSGLAMEAWAHAGVPIERTSQDQYASEVHVDPGQVKPGDLVFFAGSDGTVTAPGHVGLVIGGGQMIEAYATGYPVRISTYGTASSPPGDTDPVGFTDPAANGTGA